MATDYQLANLCHLQDLQASQLFFHNQPIIHPEAAHGMPSCDVSPPKPSSSIPETSCSGAKKRKVYSYAPSSTCEEDVSEDTRSSRRGSISDKKQNHSEIEKRRRDKMNTYITELSKIVPMCGAMARKLDKLTVLRLAVQHLRSIRGALLAGPLTAQPRPAFLSERELNALVVQAASDCFVMVIGCDRGRLMYVSESVKKMLHFDQSELFGQSFFDILHPKDIAKVKEQLSSSDLSPRERFIDAKTMLPVKADVVAGATRLTPGARRSFVCRIKCRSSLDGNQSNQSQIDIKEEKVHNGKMKKKQAHEKKYCVVQCTGYLKSWAPLEISGTSSPADSGVEDNEACNMSCLVAVGRSLSDMTALSQAQNSTFMRQLEFGSRHATDGKFLFVDQRVTVVLGFLPQEILGTSMYEYVSQSDLGVVAKAHKTALLLREALKTPPYFFRRKDGAYARIQTHFKPFRNPWTKDLECIVAKNTVITDDIVQNPTEHCQSYDVYKMNGAGPYNNNLEGGNGSIPVADLEMQRLIESHKIGSAIADEALRISSAEYSPDVPSDVLHDAIFNPQTTLVENVPGPDLSGYSSEVRNNVPLSSARATETSPTLEMNSLLSISPPSTSPPLATLGADGNGEAAMAVIMSLLEADAGLGGPVNFSGLPWPLP